MLTSLLILTFLACGVLSLWRRNRNMNEPPRCLGALPLIGHAHRIARDSIKLRIFIEEIVQESFGVGGVVSFSIGPKVFYVVANLDDYLKIANTCLEKSFVYKFARPWLGDGLATSNNPIWKTHRKLLNPAFSPSVLYGFLDIFNEQSRRLVKDLEVEVGKGPFDHWVYARDNALDTICLTILGLDLRGNQQFLEYANTVDYILNIFIERFQKFWLHSDFIYKWSSLKRKQDACVKILHNTSDYVLEKKKAVYVSENKIEKKTKGPTFKPFLDLLLELALEEGAFNDKEIREQLDTMIFAGYDTSATVIMYSILFVGSYPHVQEKIYEELSNVFGVSDRDVTKQDLQQLVYLEAVIKETMRFCPVAPIIGRLLDRNIELRNCTLLKGRTCFLSIYGVSRHPMWGPDADQFKPERWLNRNSLPDFPNVFVGFSLGKRNCYGQTYAMMSMKITLAHLYRHYIVSGDHTKLVTKLDILLKPVSGHHITIEKRNNYN